MEVSVNQVLSQPGVVGACVWDSSRGNVYASGGSVDTNNAKLAGYGKALLEAASELPLVSEAPSITIKTNKKTVSIALYEGITAAIVKENL
jgi:hypothetical protein